MRNEQERLAREWAESKLAMPTGHLDADVIAAANHILATTSPPTMADVDWDHDKHYLAGAVDAYGSEVIMHSRVDDCEIATIRPGDETHGGEELGYRPDSEWEALQTRGDHGRARPPRVSGDSRGLQERTAGHHRRARRLSTMVKNPQRRMATSGRLPHQPRDGRRQAQNAALGVGE